ncbi:MAG TPA: VWA domain-containing protein [Nitrospirota bacterium]|nr:VWA domain-containing protein [Nitrospirota bacterium]
MSGFGYTSFLWLLLAAPALALYFYRAAGRDEAARRAFAEPSMFGLLGLGGRGWRNIAPRALLPAALVLAALAVARPLGPPAEAGETEVAMDVVVALDVSDSMGVADMGSEYRLSAAKGFIKGLVAAAPGNRYGLVLFSGDAVVTCPLTLDHDAFITFLEDADYNKTGLPGTAVGEGILSAATRFRKGGLPRAVVVVSDGENTYGADPVKAAATAKERGVKVVTVGAGTRRGGRVPAGYDFFGNAIWKQDKDGKAVVSSLDADALRSVAEAGGGSYFDASGAGSVKSLAKELTTKAKKEIKDPFKGAKEYGPWFALAAAALLMAAIII